MHSCLQAIISNSQEKSGVSEVCEVVTAIMQCSHVKLGPHQNVQHNNALNAVLFEAINLAIHIDPESSVVQNAAKLLGKFILSKETNVRYLGLDSMAHLAAVSESLEPIKKHQDVIILSLKDRDISVRRRGLDLLYSMCDTSNSKTIVGELLRYLQVADYNLREEMVLKIAILTERFATEVSRLPECCFWMTLTDFGDIIVRMVCRHYPPTNFHGRRSRRTGSLVSRSPTGHKQRRSSNIRSSSGLRTSQRAYLS